LYGLPSRYCKKRSLGPPGHRCTRLRRGEHLARCDAKSGRYPLQRRAVDKHHAAGVYPRRRLLRTDHLPAVLETYSVTSCDMLPANGEETFSNFTLVDGHGNPLALVCNVSQGAGDDGAAPAMISANTRGASNTEASAGTVIFQSNKARTAA
jgi:hypothetical protein